MPDHRLGEEICAFVKYASENSHVDRQVFLEFCAGKLAHYKVPRYVKIVECFPKTNIGKIQKRKLLEMYMNEVGKENRRNNH